MFGATGCVGLILMARPCFCRRCCSSRFPVEQWDDPSLAPAVVFVVILTSICLTCLLNGMLNVIYVIAAGGLINIVSTRTRAGTSGHDDSDTPHWSRDSRQTLAAQYRSQGRLP